MKDQEDILRKKQEEVAATRNKLQAVTKKEGNNYLTKDFTDDIYSGSANAKVFVSNGDYDSGMFSDVLIVLQASKLHEFEAQMSTLVDEYYTKMDELEVKRIPDQTRANASEYAILAEHQIDEAKERVLGWAKAANFEGKASLIADC